MGWFKPKLFLMLIITGLLISACGKQPASPTTAFADDLPAMKPTKTITLTQLPSATHSPEPTSSPTHTETPTSTPTFTPTPDVRLDPADWQNWPVVPTVSARAKAIYEQGLQTGNYPDRFSKIGDCQNITTYFLAIFDNPDRYSLGPDYEYLQEAIDHFSGSYERESVATGGGMNVASVLSRYWVDLERCKGYETPLACELRLQQPAIAIISMEETWGRENKVENYEKYMRQIIETVIAAGTVPVLATKADNLEGDHLINQALARLAYEYDIPLWNFWSAVQPLPNHGLLEDGFHLSHGANYFDEPANLKRAWPVRNLTALQVIDAVWRGLNGLPLENGEW